MDNRYGPGPGRESRLVERAPASHEEREQAKGKKKKDGEILRDDDDDSNGEGAERSGEAGGRGEE